MVERALALVAEVEAPRVVDVGTGSGAIALAIADERPDARVVATDVSPDALALARENAERCGLAVELREASLLDGVERAARPRRVEPAVRARVGAGRAAAGGAGLGAARSPRSPTARPRRWCARRAGVLASGGALVLEVHEGHAADGGRAPRGRGLRGGRRHPRPGRPRARGRGAMAGVVERAAPRRAACCSRPTASTGSARRCDEDAVRRLYALKGRAERAADRGDRGEHRRAARARAGAARPQRDDRAGAAAGRVHARAAEPGAPLPVAERREPGDDRRARPGAARGDAARARRGRRRRGDERERARRACGREPRRGAGTGARRVRRRARRGPSAGHRRRRCIDFTGDEPRVLREGAAPADEALARVAAALADEGLRPHDVYD